MSETEWLPSDPKKVSRLMATIKRFSEIFLRASRSAGADRPPPKAAETPRAARKRRQRLTRKDQALLAGQTYAPASLLSQPSVLRAYLLLHNEFGGARPWTGPMSGIAAALHCTPRQARDVVATLEAANVLEVKRRAGQESEYRLLQEDQYIETPLMLAVKSDPAVCAVWGALRRTLGPGRSALRCVTAVTEVSWAAIQRMTGLCRSVVGRALRWLREHCWLSRRVVWASHRPPRRKVCRWKLCLRTSEEIRTLPRQESGQLPSGGRRNVLEPPAGSSSNLKSARQVLDATHNPGGEGAAPPQAGPAPNLRPARQVAAAGTEGAERPAEASAKLSPAQEALKAVRESGAEGVELLAEWSRRVAALPT